MKNDKEFETLLNEIPHATSSFNLQQHNNNNNHHQHHVYGHGNNGNGHGFSPLERGNGMYGMFDDDPSSHLHHQKYKPVSPVNGFTLNSEGSSSSSLVSGWFSSDDGSPTPPTFEEIKPQTPSRNTHYFDGLWSESKFVNESPLGRNSVENLMNGMSRMHIGDEIEDSLMNRRYLSGIQYGDCSSVGTRNNNVERNGFLGLGRVDGSFPMSPTSFGLERSSALLGLQRNSQRGNSLGPCISPGRYNSPFSGHVQCADPSRFQQQQTVEESWNNLQLQGNAGLVGNQYDRANQVPYTVPSVISPSMGNTMLYQQENPMYSIGHAGVSDLLCSAYLRQQQMPLGMERLMHYNLPTFNGRADGTTTEPIHQPHVPLRPASNFQVFECEDSLIIQGKGLEYVIRKRYDHLKEHRNEIGIAHFKERSPELTDHIFSRGISADNFETGSNVKNYSRISPSLKYNSLLDVEDYIYFLAKDQLGCRFLQQQFEEGSPQDKQIIFQKIIDHVVELMMNPFGNYLVQKLLEKSNAEQRMRILLMVTRRPGELIRISLNITRAVQKLINSLKTQQEKSVVISALEPGFLDLIKDLNGNHVIQHCLQHLQKEENKFIFTAAARFCLDIATHRHGCCVLQRCIAYATGEDREILISKVSSNAVRLSQDAFGNYVVQFVLDLKIPSANAALMSQFEGKYVLLSTQKFSSNVIEKCLKVFGEEGCSVIINEFLSSSQFEKLLQDPYANYVIQSALKVSKGTLFTALVEAIRPYAELLKTNPHCKKIFSWAVLKK
ncbi:hypothetical protein AQUCO_01000228v1 [Aquilegia coerulea]|uniref:PUM-HD domain-containing protein n=1 Tax=Aquilegia coerulea TaxID=218851 RepID=A0A2G5E8V9_AQUCA|nr:hypothetical protein AQUCO_01000228v1 [Aquilegia coerulea]